MFLMPLYKIIVSTIYNNLFSVEHQCLKHNVKNTFLNTSANNYHIIISFYVNQMHIKCEEEMK